VLLAGAGMLLQTLLALQAAKPGFETARVLAVNVPVSSYGRTPEQVRGFYREILRRVGAVPGVEQVAFGSTVPWRDAGGQGNSFAFSVEGRTRENAAGDPRARFRSVSPGFFPALGVPLIAGRVTAYLLISEGPRSLDEIAGALGVSRASVSTDARRLEEKGLLVRLSLPGDRRTYYSFAPDGFRTALVALSLILTLITLIRLLLSVFAAIASAAATSLCTCDVAGAD